jgi:hypothetical protein
MDWFDRERNKAEAAMKIIKIARAMRRGRVEPVLCFTSGMVAIAI